jgi:O-antigen/teichoic acid export membrane protein
MKPMSKYLPFHLQMNRIIRLAGVAALRGGGALIELIFSVTTAKLLGLSESGKFFVVLATVLVGSALGRGGYDISIVRQLATEMEVGSSDKLAGLILFGLVKVLIVSVAVTIILIALATVPFFDKALIGESRPAFIACALSIPALSSVYFLSESLKGLGQVNVGQFFYGWPVYGFALMLSLSTSPDSAGSASLVFLAASWAALLCNVVAVFLYVRQYGLNISAASETIMRKGGFDLFAIRPITLLTNWMPIWIINFTIGSAAAGAYALANRVAAALLLVSISVEAHMAPKVARLLARGDNQNAIRELHLACAVSGALTVLFAVGVSIFAADFMLAVGDEFYDQASFVIYWLLASYVLNGFVSPVSTYALMSGRDRAVLTSMILGLISAITVLVSLYERTGIVAGAIALAAAFASRAAFVYAKIR